MDMEWGIEAVSGVLAKEQTPVKQRTI